MGARTTLGSAVTKVLQAQGLNLLSDAHAFGDSAILNRGFVLDQLRRFGPYDHFINVLAPLKDEVVCSADVLPVLVEQPLRVLSAAVDLWGESDRRLLMINGCTVPHDWAPSERLMFDSLIAQAPRILREALPSLKVSVVTADQALNSPDLSKHL